MGIKYGLIERSIFGEAALGMKMETTQGAEIGARGNYDGKSEESCVGETTQVGYYGVCFGGSD